MTVRTRFAPSPTGYLHIGGVRTALFNWLFARQQGGQFVLRIDDTDRQRNVAEALQPILDGFRWLGLDWDEGPDAGGPYGPYYQSQRSGRYGEVVEQLLAAGAAYRDYARPEEYAAEREQAEQARQPFVYSRRWMAETEQAAAAFEAEGRQAVVRLKMPRDGVCRFTDLVRGPVEFAWIREADTVVQRADGSCLYHLASVVDDSDFRISHVIRSEEHLSNTPRQIFLFQALGCEPPQFAHLPYVAAPGSTAKLSKRKLKQYLKDPEFRRLFEHGTRIVERMGQTVAEDVFNPVLVDFYREVGYLPGAVVNYLLLLGWSLDDRTEDFTRDEMVRHFSLERVNKSKASFDPQKLLAFQHRHMNRVPLKQKVAMVLPYLQRAGWVGTPAPCETGPRLKSILEAAGERLKTAGDILEYDEFFVADDQLVYDEKAFGKRLGNADSMERLSDFRDRLAGVEPFDAEQTEVALRDFVAERGIKIGDIIHALRVAVTGKSVGVGMFDALAIVGRDASLARIDRALQRARADGDAATP